MTTSDLLEFLNLYLVLLDIPAMVVLAVYLARRRVNLRRKNRDLPTDFAIALLIYVTGHTLTRGWSWAWHFQRNMHLEWLMFDATPIILATTLVTTIGLVCLMRVLVSVIDTRWWIGIAAAACAIASLVTFLT
jgi:hypothetical protein